GKSKEIAGLMLMTMEPDIQRNLETLHAHEMLLKLKTLFVQQAEQDFRLREIFTLASRKKGSQLGRMF
nr:zinc finger, CCHC-type [Tanacetum cinerariifolium]